jgi:hypothetical protein
VRPSSSQRNANAASPRRDVPVRPEPSEEPCRTTSRCVPRSTHVTALDLDTAADRAIWDYARQHDYVIASKDSTQIMFRNGNFVDMNVDWNPAGCSHVLWTRKYLAIAASLRRFFGIVLTGWYNVDHQNHIHFDDSYGADPIRWYFRSDAVVNLSRNHFRRLALSRRRAREDRGDRRSCGHGYRFGEVQPPPKSTNTDETARGVAMTSPRDEVRLALHAEASAPSCNRKVGTAL